MTVKANKSSYAIGKIAQKLEVSVETIRMYERGGILLVNRGESGRRVFDDSDMYWLGCVRRLIKEERLNLEGIRRLLALLPCWDLRPCQEVEKNNCPAFRGALRPCWTMKSEIPRSCRRNNCRACNVYREATSCTNLKEVIHRL